MTFVINYKNITILDKKFKRFWDISSRIARTNLETITKQVFSLVSRQSLVNSQNGMPFNEFLSVCLSAIKDFPTVRFLMKDSNFSPPAPRYVLGDNFS